MNDIIQNIKLRIEELKNNPGALFGLLYPYVLVVIVALGLYYVSNLDFIARQKIPSVLPDTTKVSDLSIQPAKDVPPTNIFEVANPTDELLNEGEKLYKANCSSCHGDNGAGGGPAAVGLNPAPRNFTDKENWKNGMTLSAIYTTLEEGIAGGAMISYDYLLPVEKISLAHYIRDSFISDAPEDSEADLETLDLTYNLSAGQQLPAQIPIASAKEIIISESNSTSLKVSGLFKKVESGNEQGAEILKSISTDLNKSITFLLKEGSWKVSEQKFIDVITRHVNYNGFNARVFNLRDSEWSLLYSYLNRIVFG
ncbi:MAG: cytochrome c [Ignavibacteriaceae bacterium]